MFNQLAIESAAELAEILRSRPYGIVAPRPQTPLEDAVVAGLPVEETVPENQEAIKASLVEGGYTPVSLTGGVHDSITDNQSKLISDNINRRLGFAREHVNRIISELYQRIVNEISDKAPKTTVVKVVEFSNFYRHPVISQIFQGYGDGQLGVDPVEGVYGVELTPTNGYLKEYLKTGTQTIDNHIDEVIKERGDDWYSQIVLKHFQEGEPILVEKPDVSEGYREAIDRNFILHMLARHLMKSEYLPKNDKYLVDDEYRAALGNILSRTSQNINALTVLQNKLEEGDTIALSMDNLNNRVTVYAPTYRRFIERGGNDAMLIGYLRTKPRRPANGAEIISNGRAFECHYDDELRKNITEIRDKRRDIIIDFLMKQVGWVVEQLPATVLSVIPEINTDKTRSPQTILVERGISFLRSDPVFDVDELIPFLTTFLCDGLLPELDLMNFFRIMDKYIEEGRCDAKRAAYHAALEEIVSYLTSQVVIAK